MRDENLTIEELPSTDIGQRMLRLTGPLVLNSFFAFQTLIREDETAMLVLEFSAVPYIDSAGIGALVGAYVNRQKTGRSLLLVGVQPRVRTALQVTKVEQFFRFS
jgi:anti-sigma B factor antagonist